MKKYIFLFCTLKITWFVFGKAKRKRNYPSFISCCHYPSYLQYRFYSLLYCCLLAPKCSLIGFYSSKEISIVALFVSLTASIFLLSTSFRILFFSWSFSFSCSSISPLSSDFSEFYPRASKCLPHASQLQWKFARRLRNLATWWNLMSMSPSRTSW